MSDSVNTSEHAPLLNRLAHMQESSYYATARADLLAAERLIVRQEDILKKGTIQAFQREVTEWASRTFPGQTPASKAEHLLDEAGELKDDPSNGEEMADVLILLLNLAEMHGLDLLEEARKKMAINRTCTWGPPDERGVCNHVKEEDPEQKKITVCSKCLQASCWQGAFMCQEAQTAGTVEKTIAELRALGRENPCYWAITKVGKEEGEACGREGCAGIMGFEPVKNCSCHCGNPPCGACTSNPIVCLTCGANPDED